MISDICSEGELNKSVSMQRWLFCLPLSLSIYEWMIDSCILHLQTMDEGTPHYIKQNAWYIVSDIKVTSYQYKDHLGKDKTVSWPSYLYARNPHTRKSRILKRGLDESCCIMLTCITMTHMGVMAFPITHNPTVFFNSLLDLATANPPKLCIYGYLCQESTGHRGIPLTIDQLCGKCFRVMTSSC